MSNKEEAVFTDVKKLLIYWTVVLVPLGYGVVNTFMNSLPLFQ